MGTFVLGAWRCVLPRWRSEHNGVVRDAICVAAAASTGLGRSALVYTLQRLWSTSATGTLTATMDN